MAALNSVHAWDWVEALDPALGRTVRSSICGKCGGMLHGSNPVAFRLPGCDNSRLMQPPPSVRRH